MDDWLYAPILRSNGYEHQRSITNLLAIDYDRIKCSARNLGYRYNDQIVYLTKPDCCDMYELVYTTDCTVLCAPGGGFSGKGDEKCPDFYDNAKNGTLIWKKN